MCDEYDDERMRAFWRALAEREEVAKLEPETDETGAVDQPIAPIGGTLEPRRAKPRPLMH